MDMHEIEKEISILEQGDTTYQNCSKLAVLYSIRDHQSKRKWQNIRMHHPNSYL